MAKRRMITQDINIDEHLNSVSIPAQLLFFKILSVSDDCGVVPANEYTLKSLTNPVEKIRNKFSELIAELISQNLLIAFEHSGKPYLCFKRESFERQQAYLIKNRTKSEYLKITSEAFFSIYDKILALPEISGNSSKFPQVSLLTHKEIKDKSIKIEDKSQKIKEGEVLEIWNAFAKQAGLSQVKALSDSRKQKLNTRINNNGFDFIKILEAIKLQPFLLGENKSSWKITFDWIIENDKNYLKVLEGNYQSANQSQTGAEIVAREIYSK